MSEMTAFADCVAVVGMACRFPGANNIKSYWHNLSQGIESVSFFAESELDTGVIDPIELSNPDYVKARAILDHIDQFDARFFGFTPREAQLTDPQHRLFLECAWEALEHAGYDPEKYSGSIGVYGGAGANTYLLFHLNSAGYLVGSIPILQAFIHNKNDHLTTRIAYKLNLRGPSMTIQTACSTSLVAVATAYQSLLNFQVDMVLAGGVAITVPQRTGYLYHEHGIASPDGHCRPFDAQAKGTVGGNGAGLVVLKRYEDAVADGDTIYALIRGAAVNNDGSLRAGYTAPNADSQAEVIALAQALSDVHPESITYVEAHGTATPIGDPIEVEALTKAFRRHTNKTGFCALGSVKSNIGHLDAAAGVAGFIKTVLSLNHKAIPPSLHFQTPNPQIDFDSSPFFVNTALRQWPDSGTPRRAGVSSFGLGGTNAHIILEEAPMHSISSASRPWQLLLLSAQTPSALETASINLASYFQENPTGNLADVSYTLQLGRKAFDYRRIVVCQDSQEAAQMLADLLPERVFSRHQIPTHRPLTFMFPGQGSQHINMALALYQGEPLFRKCVDNCCTILEPHLKLDLRDLLYPQEDALAGDLLQLNQTQYTQPAIFVIEYALAQLWLSWGVQPDAMIGHSIGEYVAACLAGVFSLEDALALIAARGRLIQSLPEGTMLSVPLSENDVQPYLSDEVTIAAVNGLAQCVVSGSNKAIDALELELTEQKLLCRRLQTSHAFHSPMMMPILSQFAQVVSQIRLTPPQIPYISNVTGSWITAAEATDPQYWVQHIWQTVRFADGLTKLLQEPNAILLEVGPGRTLRTLTRWHPYKTPNQFMLATLPHVRENQPEYLFLLHTIGQLWLAGIDIDWAAFYAYEQRRRLPLPTYPFERERYWVDLRPNKERSTDRSPTLSKLPDIADWSYVPGWKMSAISKLAYGQELFEQKQVWLLLLNDTSLVGKLQHQLNRSGQTVICVRSGDQFRQVNEHLYEINPKHKPDYAALFTSLSAAQILPNTIIHAWNLSQIADENDSFYSLLFLTQELTEATRVHPAQIVVLSNNMQSVTGNDLLYPEKALLLGPCLVIPREYPHLTCRSLDITLPPADSHQEVQLTQLLLWEIASSQPEPIIAYRHGCRWQPTFEALKLPAPTADFPALFAQGKVWLITGGLGGLGLQMAEYLARSGSAKLVLTGRSTFPAREQWSKWLANHGSNNLLSRKIRRIQALEARGVQVSVYQVDVTDESQMRELVNQVTSQWGPIQGVIHAAGVAGGGMIQLKEQGIASAVLAPKVKGTRVLEAVFADTKLDAFILFSSLTSVVGRLGQVDYTAANAFLDAFTQYYQMKTDTLAISINWGAWEEVGMAAQEITDDLDAEMMDHPLLEWVIRGQRGENRYLTDFAVDKHWVLDEHRILGNPVIPGVAYFEMVRAALGEDGQNHIVEFQDVLFVAPLRVADGESREVQLILNKEANGFKFSICSYDEAAGKLRDYTIGRGQLLPAEVLQAYDLEAIQQRCNKDELFLAEEEREEDLGPRWHSVQRVHLGNNEALLYLELPQAFAADFDVMKFHPALLDRAAGIAKNFLAKEGRYLPLTYKKLQIKAPLQREIYSYACFREEEDPSRETITFDIILMDKEGRGLVEIEGFSQKRVNDPAAEIRALAHVNTLPELVTANGTKSKMTHPLHTTPAKPSKPANILPHEGIEAFKRILINQIGPRIIISAHDLETTIHQTDDMVRQRILQAANIHQKPTETLYPRPQLKTAYIAPRNDTEQRIAQIWQSVLAIEKIGVHDNFFELGGDSLIAIQLLAQLEREFNTNIPPVSIFDSATIDDLSALIMPLSTEQFESTTPVYTLTTREQPNILPRQWHVDETTKHKQAPLSFGQQQIWFLSQLDTANAIYNTPHLTHLCGDLDLSALAQSLNEIIRRHDILRTTFQVVNDVPVQIIAPELSISLPITDLQHLPEDEGDNYIQSVIIKEANQSFDLAKGPLIRATLFQTSTTDYLLLLNLHHIISDAWSITVLIQELGVLYKAYVTQETPDLPQLPIQFADYAGWQQQWLQGGQLAPLLNYWTTQLSKPLTTLALPTDYSRPPIQTYNGALQQFALSKALVEALKQLGQQEETTLFMTLLATFKALLHRYTGQTDIIVGSPIANRSQLETHALIGFFVNTLVLRTDVGGDLTFQQLLQKVKEMATGAYAHQTLPLEKLVNVLNPQRDPSRSPLFQVMFDLHNIPLPSLRLPKLRITPQPQIDMNTAMFDLTLTMTRFDDGLQGIFEYNTDLFCQTSIQRMQQRFQTLLASVVTNPHERISKLPF
jgi:phthiocerol/phenolphthiocerol synthesis type-I polyketide synthase E